MRWGGRSGERSRLIPFHLLAVCHLAWHLLQFPCSVHFILLFLYVLAVQSSATESFAFETLIVRKEATGAHSDSTGGVGSEGGIESFFTRDAVRSL